MRVQDLRIREQKDPDLFFAIQPEELSAAKILIQEYADSLDFSLDFQDFDHEIEHLTDHYHLPTGFILLAKQDDDWVGVACLHPLEAHIAEIKRMYVQPKHRGKGIGRRMLHLIIDEAQQMGYRFLRLDTVPIMEAANHLYKSMGFYEIEDYTYNPLPGATFLEYHL